MYTKNQQNGRSLKLAAGTLVSVLLVGAGIGAYYFLNKSDQEPVQTATKNSSPATAGVIARFNQDGTLSDSSNNQQQEPQTQAKVSYSKLPYSLALPAGWSETDSKAVASPCNDGSESTTKTYKNGQETLVIYENGTPDGCKLTSAADAYIDFDFSEDGSGITINDSVISQCSKADNPNCPKGDGKVSVFIGNENPNKPENFMKSTITDKSYFFSITDTKIDSDFVTQVKSLLGLISSFKIN